jgi:tetratricopeptide (TPR) repeat protein
MRRDARIHMTRAMLHDSDDAFPKMAESAQRALDLWDEAGRKASGWRWIARAAIVRVRGLAGSGSMIEALGEEDRCVTAAGWDDGEPRHAFALARVRRECAYAALLSGDPERARVLFAGGIDALDGLKTPDQTSFARADLLDGLGRVLRSMGRYDEALTAYRNAVAALGDAPERPDNSRLARAHAELSIACLHAGELDNSLAAGEEARRLFSETPEFERDPGEQAWLSHSLALAYWRADQTEEAIELASTAVDWLERMPDDERDWERVYQLQRLRAEGFQILDAPTDAQTARALVAAAYARMPLDERDARRHADFLLDQARSEASAGRFPDANVLLTEAIDACSAEADSEPLAEIRFDAARLRALVTRDSGRAEDAVEQLKALASAAPGAHSRGAALSSLAACLNGLDRHEEAATAYADALEAYLQGDPLEHNYGWVAAVRRDYAAVLARLDRTDDCAAQIQLARHELATAAPDALPPVRASAELRRTASAALSLGDAEASLEIVLEARELLADLPPETDVIAEVAYVCELGWFTLRRLDRHDQSAEMMRAAVDAAERLGDRAPTDWRANMLRALGETLDELERYDEAKIEHDRAIAAADGAERPLTAPVADALRQAYVGAASSREQAGEFAAAIPFLNRAESVDGPTDEPVTLAHAVRMRARCLAKNGNPDAAIAAYMRALEQVRSIDNADDDEGALILRAEASAALARVLNDADRVDEAIEALDETMVACDLLDDHESDFRLSNEEFRANLFDARGAIAHQDASEAIVDRFGTRAQRDEETRVRARIARRWSAIAWSRFHLGDRAGSEAAYGRSRELLETLDDTDAALDIADAWDSLASTLSGHDRDPEALECIERAVELLERADAADTMIVRVSVFMTRSCILGDLLRRDEALADAYRAVALVDGITSDDDTRDLNAHWEARARLNLSTALTAMDRHDDALGEIELAAKAITPADNDRHNRWVRREIVRARATTLSKLHRHDDAIAEAATVPGLVGEPTVDPANAAYALTSLAYLQHEAGRYEQSAETDAQIVAMFRALPAWHFRIHCVACSLARQSLSLVRMGRLDDAESRIEETFADIDQIPETMRSLNHAKAAVVDTLHARAELLNARGDRNSALAAYRTMVELHESFPYFDAKYPAYLAAKAALQAG